MRPLLLVLLALFPLSDCLSQDTKTSKGKNGTVYFNWGWNRSAYTLSNIRFTGTYYNFTLHKVKATDRPSPFGLDPHFHPKKITIPQVNYGAGYFLKSNWCFYVGVDHMKYVTVLNQQVNITGTILSTPFAGTYNDSMVTLSKKFIQFEHTDGLNYVHMEISKYDTLFQYKNVLCGTLMKGGSGGIIYPRTNATLFGNERYDEFNIAGYGVACNIGLHVSFWNHFFIRLNTKGGFIHMPNIRTTQYVDDKASQHFFFLQANLLFGGMINLKK